MATLICVPIMVADAPSALADAQAAIDMGADLVELRLDEFFSGDLAELPAITQFVSDCPAPCIVTCRPASEGGHYDGDDAARVALFERLGAVADAPGIHPPRFIDIEAAVYTRSANLKQKINLAVRHPDQLRDLSTSLILSMHDLSGRPANLLRRIDAMQREPAAAVVKVACRARSLRDTIEFLDLHAHIHKPAAVMAMGDYAAMSRVLAPKFGAFLVYAALRAGAATAPGQIPLRDLLELYRFRAVGRSTRVYGVIGWPVAQSLSPLIHNAGFESANYNAVYLPLPIAAAEDPELSYLSFKATLLELMQHPRLDFSGASVTHPHKHNLLRLAREEGWTIDPFAAAVKNANTLIIEREGPGLRRVRVLNTDGPAAADALEAGLSLNPASAHKLAGLTIAILGGGGAAAAAALALAHRGATCILYTRNVEQGQALAASLTHALSLLPGGTAPSATAPGRIIPAAWDLLPKTCANILINATPIGMKGTPLQAHAPIDLAALTQCSPSLVVMDMVYNPLETPLLSQAHMRGLRTIDGLSMFVRQAAAQFDAWTLIRPPTQLFERICREALSDKP